MAGNRPKEYTREPARSIGRPMEKDVAPVEALKQCSGSDAAAILPADSRALIWHRANALRHKLDYPLVMDDFSHDRQGAMLATLLKSGDHLIEALDNIGQAGIGRQRLHRAPAAAGDDFQVFFDGLVKTSPRLLGSGHLGDRWFFHSAFRPCIVSASLTDLIRTAPVRPTATLAVRNPAGSLKAD